MSFAVSNTPCDRDPNTGAVAFLVPLLPQERITEQSDGLTIPAKLDTRTS